jgi:hypothetical protein
MRLFRKEAAAHIAVNSKPGRRDQSPCSAPELHERTRSLAVLVVDPQICDTHGKHESTSKGCLSLLDGFPNGLLNHRTGPFKMFATVPGVEKDDPQCSCGEIDAREIQSMKSSQSETSGDFFYVQAS